MVRVPHVGHCGGELYSRPIQGFWGFASRDVKMKKAGRQGCLGEDTEISQDVECRLSQS